MPTLADFDFFLNAPIKPSGFRAYTFPSKVEAGVWPNGDGYTLSWISGSTGDAHNGLTEDEVVTRLSEFAAAHPAAA